jgi:hypothetical protein
VVCVAGFWFHCLQAAWHARHPVHFDVSMKNEYPAMVG